jgi:N-acylneuraminate cytidylyltransferase
MKKAIAIITARGGSKRIPNKNIKEFCGKPIISYPIEAAISSGVFDEVMVSTDSVEIADIALSYGAKVPFMRSDKTSDDFANTEDVIKEVLVEYEKIGDKFEKCCCIYPTSAFVTGKVLEDTYIKLSEFDSVVPVVRYSFPIQRAFRIRNNNLEFVDEESAQKRSQDLEVMYHDTGQFYWFDVEKFYEHNSVMTDKTYGYEISENKVRDIDTLEDWKIAEVLYKCINLD